MKKVTTALALVVATGVVGAPELQAQARPQPLAPVTIVVDQGVQQCGTPTFTTADGIQLAIAKAKVGITTTIKVCPGSYTAVNVTKSLAFVGKAVTATTPAQCGTPASWGATDPTMFAVVNGGGANPAFTVDGVDGVTISGFTIQNAPSGVHTTAATDGLTLSNDVIQNNTMGVYLNGGSTTRNTVTANCIRVNTRPGAASGNGIYSDQGLNAASITQNTFLKNDNAGDGGAVNLPAGTITGVTIAGNTANGDTNFVSVHGSTKTTISGNTTTGILGGAVFLDGGNTYARITSNTFSNGHDDGIGIGGGLNDFALIYGNTISNNATDGIDTSGDDSLRNSLIGSNTVTGNGEHGIRLVGAGNTGIFVTGNSVTTNGVSAADNCQDDGFPTDIWFANNPECVPA